LPPGEGGDENAAAEGVEPVQEANAAIENQADMEEAAQPTKEAEPASAEAAPTDAVAKEGGAEETA